MNIVKLSPEYVYDNLRSGQKIFYKLVPIPFSELPKKLQDKVKRIEDME